MNNLLDDMPDPIVAAVKSQQSSDDEVVLNLDVIKAKLAAMTSGTSTAASVSPAILSLLADLRTSVPEAMLTAAAASGAANDAGITNNVLLTTTEVPEQTKNESTEFVECRHSMTEFINNDDVSDKQDETNVVNVPVMQPEHLETVVPEAQPVEAEVQQQEAQHVAQEAERIAQEAEAQQQEAERIAHQQQEAERIAHEAEAQQQEAEAKRLAEEAEAQRIVQEAEAKLAHEAEAQQQEAEAQQQEAEAQQQEAEAQQQEAEAKLAQEAATILAQGVQKLHTVECPSLFESMIVEQTEALSKPVKKWHPPRDVKRNVLYPEISHVPKKIVLEYDDDAAELHYKKPEDQTLMTTDARTGSKRIENEEPVQPVEDKFVLNRQMLIQSKQQLARSCFTPPRRQTVKKAEPVEQTEPAVAKLRVLDDCNDLFE